MTPLKNPGQCRVSVHHSEKPDHSLSWRGGFKITHSDTASKLKWVDKCSIYLNFGFEHQFWYQKVSFYILWVDRMLGKH